MGHIKDKMVADLCKRCGEPQQLYVVGHVGGDHPEAWQIRGVYDDEAKAVAVCCDDEHFVGPVIMNATFPFEACDWPGLWFPTFQKKPAD